MLRGYAQELDQPAVFEAVAPAESTRPSQTGEDQRVRLVEYEVRRVEPSAGSDEFVEDGEALRVTPLAGVLERQECARVDQSRVQRGCRCRSRLARSAS